MPGTVVAMDETNAVAVSFTFRGGQVPVTFGPHLTKDLAARALESSHFRSWVRRCEEVNETPGTWDAPGTVTKRIEMRGVEIQSVDMFGSMVGFVKIKADCSLVEELSVVDRSGATKTEVVESTALPGICLLRGHAVSILVALLCTREERLDANCWDDSAYCLLVDQPRIPIGQVSCLELPAGMMEGGSIAGTAVMELREECGIEINPEDVVDLTALAFSDAPAFTGEGDDTLALLALPNVGLPPSPGGCDERIRYLYLERRVTQEELDSMKGRLTGLREHGEVITLRVVPMQDVWKISRDAKAIISLFLVEKLRQQGKLPQAGCLAIPLTSGRPTLMPTARRLEDETCDPQIRLHNGATIPQLAFGMYMVPNDASGEAIVLDAIRAGYRHFDTASYYGNEAMLGRALQASNVPREAMYVSTKVWNDAVKNGRDAVRQSVLESLQHLQIDYVDLVLIHWPVPEHFVDAYKELEDLVEQGKIKSIGLSNFTPQEYQELVKSGITVHPVVNQIEVSPLMYRPKLVQYFQEHWIAVAASKSLNRAACLDHPAIVATAKRHSVTPAQVVLRWSVQKGLVVVTKTSNPNRMKENRSVVHFSLSVEDMVLLDSLTPPEAIRERDELEAIRKASL